MHNTLIPLLISLIPMLCIGISFFLNAKLSRAVGAIHATFLLQVLGIPMFALLLPFTTLSIQHPVDVVPSILLGCFIAGLLSLSMYAMKVGNISLTVPIFQAYVVIVSLLGIIFFHERISLLKVVSILCVVTGLIFLSFNMQAFKDKEMFKLNKGVLPALLNAVGTGFYFFFVAFQTRRIGWFATALTIRIAAGLSILLVIMAQKNMHSHLFRNVPWIIGFMTAFFDVIGFSVYSFAVMYYEVSYVTVITSVSSLVTVILGYVFFKEKLKITQFSAMFMIIVGIVALQLS